MVLPWRKLPCAPDQCRSSHPGTPYGAPCKHLYPRNPKWRISSKLRQSKQHLPGLFPAKPKENRQNRGKQIFSAARPPVPPQQGSKKDAAPSGVFPLKPPVNFPFLCRCSPPLGGRNRGSPSRFTGFISPSALRPASGPGPQWQSDKDYKSPFPDGRPGACAHS